ncbi:ABC transporter ATP-binding protein [Anaerolineae bacterium CFX7]|nr:ABC transporter ATP-binding protein [Anaerolineae bacterium CFX7]
MQSAPLLAVRQIEKTYANAALLRGISFDAAAGEIVCVLGPSGTGKTTLLRIIAGLEQAAGGQILFRGMDLQNVPPHARGFGFMFQDLALFPHKNVAQNVAFGLRMKNVSAAETTARVHETLALVGLDPAAFATRDVNHLSGGEQQRVALARTLAPRPPLILFDEPLGALDRGLREELSAELRALLKRLQATALYVTHDQDEAFALADRLLLLNAGCIAQSGAPVEVYQKPANEFVARFMGLTNLLEIRTSKIQGAVCRVETDAGIFVLDALTAAADATARFLLLRPKALERIVAESTRDENSLRGRVVETQFRAGHQQIIVETRAGKFAFEWDAALELNQEYIFALDAQALQLVAA